VYFVCRNNSVSREMMHNEQKNSNGILRQVIASGWIHGTPSCGWIFEYKRDIATKYMYDLHSGLTSCSSSNVFSSNKEKTGDCI